MLELSRVRDSFASMNTAKSLSEEQIATIRSWAEEGADLSDIQRKLGDELEIRVTYLETRFLLEDLKIELIPEPEPVVEEEAEEEAVEDQEGEEPSAEEEIPGEPAGDVNVSVTIDTVQRPGAIVSGRVTFSGGSGAAWSLDQMGRLSMDADDPSYKPSEEELISFQHELQKAVQNSGM